MQYLNLPVDACCPLCSSGNCRLLYTVDSRAAAQHFVLREVLPDVHEALRLKIESLWSGETCRVVTCRDCELTFADPFVAGDAEFYRLAYPQSHYPQWRWEFDLTLQRLSALVRDGTLSKPRILEVGAGNGALTRRLIEGVTGADGVVCTEYSAAGRERILALGVTCIAADVRDARFNGDLGSFDAVVLSQVFEHLDSINLLIRRLATFIRNDGYLFISVPGDGMINFYEENHALLNMPPNHITNWRRRTFDVLAQKAGFRLVEHRVQAFSPLVDFFTYAKYIYLRKSQQVGTLASRIERHAKSKPISFAGRIAAVAWYSLENIKGFIKLLRQRPGKTQWVLLQKRDSSASELTASAA